MDLTIIGVPFNGDGTPLAVENPAEALRGAGLVSLRYSESAPVKESTARRSSFTTTSCFYPDLDPTGRSTDRLIDLIADGLAN
jgi:hypothetical protein